MKLNLLKAAAVISFCLTAQLSALDETILIPHAPQPNNYDGFGRCVSIKGDLAVVGAYYDDQSVIDQGLVYVYRKTANGWTQEQVLSSDEPGEEGCYGVFTDIIDNQIVIGANNDMYATGSVYFYSFNGTYWEKSQRVNSPDVEQLDDFGYHLSISGDNMVVGAPGDDDLFTNSGAAYMFKKVNGNWTQTQILHAPDAEVYDGFGQYCAVEGNVAAVSSFQKGSGWVYIYKFNGTEWVYDQKFTATDADNGDWFGRYIVFKENKLYISATMNDENGDDAGAVYIFSNNGTTWVQEQKLIPSTCTELANFGEGISISGNRLAVGALFDREGGFNAGAVFLYNWNGTQWVYDKKVMASDIAEGDTFGESVALDGDQMIVGAYFKDWSGKSYIYNLIDNSAPVATNLSGNIAEIGNAMQLTLTVSEDTGVASVIGKVNLNGVLSDLPMTPAGKKVTPTRNGSKATYLFTGTLPAQTQVVNGTIKFEMTDTTNPAHQGTSDEFTIKWKVPDVVLLTEGFEGTAFPPDGWSSVDKDGDGWKWQAGPWTPHDGVKHATSASYGDSGPLNPDNWLILPQLTNVGQISYWVCAQDWQYAAEKYGVFVSTTGTAPEDFQEVFSEVMTAKSPGQWSNREIDLSQFTGPVYIAFRHWDCTDQWYLVLDEIKVIATTGIEADATPESPKLLQNYPNPFNPTTVISFYNPVKAVAELTVYNAKGEIVRELLNSEVSAGLQNVTFDASSLNSGIYYYTLKIGKNQQSCKMLLVK